MRNFLEWVLVLAIAVACALGIRAFVVETYEVPTGSMLDTIQIGDRLVGEKISYHFSSPQAGQVVTFDDPMSSGTILVKRVIAVAGDTVDIHDGAVYVNGVKLVESYTEGKVTEKIASHGSNLTADVSYPYVVPEGSIWVMGDNRTNSLDSRYFGAVSVSSVSSHAFCIFWPFSDAKSL